MFGYEHVEPLQLQELLQAEEILLIDVRTPTESARGGIPGARNIPLHLLPLLKEELSDDRTVVFYCQSGNRSAQACAFMAGQGRRKVFNLGNCSRRCPTSAIRGVVRGGSRLV